MKNLFSVQLKASLEADNLKQGALADGHTISQAQISRYLSGENRPPPETLDLLLPRFSDEQALLVALAYVEDYIPPSKSRLIKVELQNRRGLAQVPTVNYSRVPTDVRRALERLAAAASENPTVATYIRSADALVQAARSSQRTRRRGGLAAD